MQNLKVFTSENNHLTLCYEQMTEITRGFPTFKSFMISAEMIGFTNLDPRNTYPTGVHYFSKNSKINSISKISRGQFMYTGVFNQLAQITFYEPVPLESYVQFSFTSYFLAFIGILLLQSFTIFIIDIFLLKDTPSTVTVWERIIHAIQKSHLPFPIQNWHEGQGSSLDHIKRHKLVQKEVLIATIVNLAFNMVMLIPLVILCKKKKCFKPQYSCNLTKTLSDQGILVRHNQLNEHLGVLEMEKESFHRSQLLSWILFPTWIVMSIIQTVCFVLANGKFHPLAAILKGM